MNKELYLTPTLEVISFEAEDVITTSVAVDEAGVPELPIDYFE